MPLQPIMTCGKNPPGDPWGEERINDRHLTRAEKQQARREAAGA